MFQDWGVWGVSSAAIKKLAERERDSCDFVLPERERECVCVCGDLLQMDAIMRAKAN